MVEPVPTTPAIDEEVAFQAVTGATIGTVVLVEREAGAETDGLALLLHAPADEPELPDKETRSEEVEIGVDQALSVVEPLALVKSVVVTDGAPHEEVELAVAAAGP